MNAARAARAMSRVIRSLLREDLPPPQENGPPGAILAARFWVVWGFTVEVSLSSVRSVDNKCRSP
jgi:hypothetical protein